MCSIKYEMCWSNVCVNCFERELSEIFMDFFFHRSNLQYKKKKRNEDDKFSVSLCIWKGFAKHISSRKYSIFVCLGYFLFADFVV